MRILLLEPYCGGSHRAWAEGYAAHSRHDVTLLALPARFWKWRMQGGALTLAEQARALSFRPDLILASDMLNLPAFLGLTRDFLSGVPTALYLHENQLTYPLPPASPVAGDPLSSPLEGGKEGGGNPATDPLSSPLAGDSLSSPLVGDPLSSPLVGGTEGGQKRDLTYGMINWLSMLAADRVFFNSRYHREEWFDELPRLLKHFPDYTHIHRIAEVQAKSEVLPVGCDLRRLDQGPTLRRFPEPSQGFPLILWNQRWEYDKDPETFFRALYALCDEGVDFRVALAGRNYRQSAPEFRAARAQLGTRVVHFGYADDVQYAALLHQADVVVSTARHEFFGVAVVEAIYGGCFPVLPRRLAYPELIPQSYHEDCLYEDFEGLVTRLRWALTHPEPVCALAAELRPAVARFDWTEMGPCYDRAMTDVAVPVSPMC